MSNADENMICNRDNYKDGTTRYVVQSFVPGKSTTWHDEAWSERLFEAESYIMELRKRNPTFSWRMVHRMED